MKEECPMIKYLVSIALFASALTVSAADGKQICLLEYPDFYAGMEVRITDTQDGKLVELLNGSHDETVPFDKVLQTLDLKKGSLTGYYTSTKAPISQLRIDTWEMKKVIPVILLLASGGMVWNLRPVCTVETLNK